MKNIELRTNGRTRDSTKRQFVDIRNDIIANLLEFVPERFEIDKDLADFADPFIKFCASAEEVRDVHKTFAPDLSLATLSIEYTSLLSMNLWKNDSLSKKIQNMKTHENAAQFNCVSTVFARIQSLKKIAAFTKIH